MATIKHAVYALFSAALLFMGCATSPVVEERRQAMEADIDAILSEPIDAAQYGEAKRCLADREYTDFRALDERRILFHGRGDKLWLNTLRLRCPDLRFGDTLQVRSFSWARICEMDSFQVVDWFDWPWYRRWPWHWRADWGMGMQCTLGKFQPITESQLGEIEAVLKSR